MKIQARLNGLDNRFNKQTGVRTIRLTFNDVDKYNIDDWLDIAKEPKVFVIKEYRPWWKTLLRVIVPKPWTV